MRSDKKAVLVFGCGELQKSIIGRAHKRNLFVVGIDPCPDAFCKDDVDAFEITGGQDFDGTCSVIEKYGIDAIVTAATDKPLVMMARVAEKYRFPFFSVDTARWSTDKFQMKQRFQEYGIPHAKGRLVKSVEEADGLVFPVIVKPRDNSGSRGVKLCKTLDELHQSVAEAFEYSKLDSVLVEEYIEGQEYSIEALHYCAKTEVIQFTEKQTTVFPYNVELGHKQPAYLSDEQMDEIREIVARIGSALKFENCPSHTELKINERGIFIIETSPRLGGDFITSTLVPLSTGINMEDQLLRIALGEPVDTQSGRVNKAAAVEYFCFPEGKVVDIDYDRLETLSSMQGIHSLDLKLHVGDPVKPINSRFNLYGSFLISGESIGSIDHILSRSFEEINKAVTVS